MCQCVGEENDQQGQVSKKHQKTHITLEIKAINKICVSYTLQT
jgi:hypothetical protein